MVRLPKINIGTKQRKNYHNFSHDVETTSDFGFCQPTVISHINAGSSSKLTTNVGVRLAPLPVPTFGRIRLKTYNSFVPMNEVFEAFDYFQKGTAVQSVLGSYIPTEAPYIPNFMLRDFIILSSLNEYVNLFTYSSPNWTLNKNWEGTPFLNFSYMTPDLRRSNWKIVQEFDEEREGVLTHVKKCQFNDYTFMPFGAPFSAKYSDERATSLYQPFYNYLLSRNQSAQGARFSVSSLLYDEVYGLPNSLGTFLQNNPLYASTLCLDVFSGRFDDEFNPVKKAFNFNRPTGLKADMILSSDFTGTLHFAELPAEDESQVVYEFEDVPYMFCANWTKRGQRLFKIFNVMGLRGFGTTDPQELAPLFAYYKAWFDIMNPGRVRQWKETPCYRLIHSFYDTGVQIEKYLNGTELSPSGETFDFWNTFNDFLLDLTECCYVLPVDHFTAATLEPLQAKETIDPITLHRGDGQEPMVVSGDDGDNYPHYTMLTGQPLDGMIIQTLLSLYKLANKNSVIGSRIEDYLRTKYGYTIAKSQQLQGSEMVIKIEEIFANAGTTENYLGEIGGRGSNDNGATNTIKFEADKFGFFIQFMCIVPFGDYVQGNMKSKIVKNDWYQAQYDSLFKEGLSMSEIMARSNVLYEEINTEHFGDVPVYWRDKWHFSTHNGAFALPSQRDTIIPYSLDRLFDEKRLKFVIPNDASETGDFEIVNGSTINCGEELRYIGRNADYGSYDRIFFDNTGYFDNFILHIVQDWDYYSEEDSISKSFGTYDDEHDDSTTSISHS